MPRRIRRAASRCASGRPALPDSRSPNSTRPKPTWLPVSTTSWWPTKWSAPTSGVGSTPTAMHSGKVPGVTEIRPGNYVFYDRMQVALGVATLADCALSVLVRVISRPDATRAVLDAGSKTFALDRGAHGMEALPGFGQDRQHGLILQRLSEEHAVCEVHDQRICVGDRLRIVPNHACTVANLAEVLVGVRGG